jgi:hypothetical protein
MHPRRRAVIDAGSAPSNDAEAIVENRTVEFPVLRESIGLLRHLDKHAVSTAGGGYFGLICGGGFPAAFTTSIVCRKHLIRYSVKAVTPFSPTP